MTTRHTTPKDMTNDAKMEAGDEYTLDTKRKTTDFVVKILFSVLCCLVTLLFIGLIISATACALTEQTCMIPPLHS